jgi:hypothetical protein
LKAIKKTCNPVKSVLLKGVDMRHVLIFKPSSVPDWTIIYVLIYGCSYAVQQHSGGAGVRQPFLLLDILLPAKTASLFLACSQACGSTVSPLI